MIFQFYYYNVSSSSCCGKSPWIFTEEEKIATIVSEAERSFSGAKPREQAANLKIVFKLWGQKLKSFRNLPREVLVRELRDAHISEHGKPVPHVVVVLLHLHPPIYCISSIYLFIIYIIYSPPPSTGRRCPRCSLERCLSWSWRLDRWGSPWRRRRRRWSSRAGWTENWECLEIIIESPGWREPALVFHQPQVRDRRSEWE